MKLFSEQIQINYRKVLTIENYLNEKKDMGDIHFNNWTYTHYIILFQKYFF